MSNAEIRSQIARQIRIIRNVHRGYNAAYGYSESACCLNKGQIIGLRMLASSWFPKRLPNVYA